MKRTILKNLIFCAIASAIIGSIYFFIPAPVMHDLGSFGKALKKVDFPEPKLSDIAKESLDLMGEMNKYLTAIAFGIIAVLGNILVGMISREKKETIFTLSLFVLSMVLALSSIIFGYLLYTKLFEIISHKIIDLREAQVVYAQDGQFYTLLSATFLFIWYLFNSFFDAAKK